MKHSTNSRRKKLPPVLARSILRTHGMSAAIVRASGISKSFVSEVLSGRKPPSRRFIEALPAAFEELSLLSQARVFELAGAAIEIEEHARR